jgi:hypothetical protein
MRIRWLTFVLAGLPCLGLGASSWVDDPGPEPTFSIGGTVDGAAGVLTLQNSNGTLVSVTGDGTFRFETPMVPSALYNVTVAVPPSAQTCAVANGSGTVGRTSITDVVITCR